MIDPRRATRSTLADVISDYLAPIVRNTAEGRELMMARWGMPGPPQFGSAPITNIRNTKSAHWRAWLAAFTPLRRAVHFILRIC